MKRVLTLVLLVQFAAAGPVAAQSLAAVAEKEEARRKTVRKPSRVYTNKDVTPSDRRQPAPSDGAPGQSVPAAADGAAAAEGPGAAEGSAAGAAETGQAAGAPTEEEQRADDEERWRSRMADARAALERNEMFAQALESRINALWADFTARDDPAQRAVIDAERKKAIAQLDRVKAEMVAQQKAIADIEEEARRAGVPPGWLR